VVERRLVSDADLLHPKWYSDRYWVSRRLRQAMAGIIRKYAEENPPKCSPNILVDLGCGAMPYKPLWAPLVDRYLGVDLAENRSADLHFEGPERRVPLADHTAGIVLSTQVLEHVPSPEAYLAEARRVLRPDGLLILSTHGFWMYHPSPTDYWRWTADGLKLLLERTGWEVVGFEGVLGFAAGAIQLFQDAAAARIPRGLRGLFVVVMQRFVRLADACYSRAGRTLNCSVFVVVAGPRPNPTGQ
jgi:SAM-dependent methyltransferase